jgi:hypothetical protein
VARVADKDVTEAPGSPASAGNLQADNPDCEMMLFYNIINPDCQEKNATTTPIGTYPAVANATKRPA